MNRCAVSTVTCPAEAARRTGAGRLRLFALLLLLLGVLPSAVAAPGGKPLRVVTSIPPVHCFTLNVAGDLARVDSLSSGGSAHDFQFTFRERRRLESAQVVVVNGLGMESWLAKALQQSGPKTVVQAAAGLDPELIRGNPHIWLDPIMATRMVTNILVALQQADPANAAGYASNATAFVARLHRLDADIRAGLAGITNRAIVTAHDAFPYFARRYDLRVVGLVEVVADVAPTAGQLSALRQTIDEHGVRAMFVDTHHSGRQARRLAKDFKVRVGVLDTLEGASGRASAYEDGMRANLRALVKELQ